jgi:hypothetical protein
MKTSMLIVILVAVGALSACSIVAYLALREKSRDAGKLAPYNKVVGTEVALVRPMVLVALNNKGMYSRQPHTLVEIDARRAEWETPVTTLPAGARLHIDQALHIKNSHSGITGSLLLGRVTVASSQREIAFEYQWGQQRENVLVPASERYWTFPPAPWQSQPITEKFVFEEL